MTDPGERLRNLFLNELRSAVSARIEAGADPGEVSADLGRRLRRLRSMQQETVLHHSARTSDAPE